ncbi:hypothetical protein JOE51_004902 [Bradyrhizobium japonicum]|nr:hypothetical protein [Bradyrhizobium japonicum]
MTKQPGAELDVDAVRRVCEQVDAQRSENGLEQGQRDETRDQDIERADASMHEYLVDDDLEEQRGDEGKDLKEERRDQHFAEKPAILVDRTEKPADIESPGEIRQGRTPGHQDDVAVPDGLEFGLRHGFGAGRQWTLNEKPVVDNLAQDQEAAVAQRGDCRQRRDRKPIPA